MPKPYPINELEKSIDRIKEICKEYKINPNSLKAYGLVVGGESRWSASLDLLAEPLEGITLSSWDYEDLIDELNFLNLSYKVSVITKKMLLDNEEKQEVTVGTYSEIADEAVLLQKIIELHKLNKILDKNNVTQLNAFRTEPIAKIQIS